MEGRAGVGGALSDSATMDEAIIGGVGEFAERNMPGEDTGVLPAVRLSMGAGEEGEEAEAGCRLRR